MSYLICQRCFGYYELQENEFLEDFESCECGGFLELIEDIAELADGDMVGDPGDTSSYVCPNIYCSYKKSLKKGEDCPQCGTRVTGRGFKESMDAWTNSTENITEPNPDTGVYDIECPNPLCGYRGFHNSQNCPECGISLDMGEKRNITAAVGLFSIKSGVEIQKRDHYRKDD